MRSYSELEKNIIKDICQVQYDQANIMDIVSKNVLKDCGLVIDCDEQLVKILIKSKNISKINEIFEALFFVKYLESNNFIYLHYNYESLPAGQHLISSDKSLIDKMQKKSGEGYSSLDVPTNLIELVQQLQKSFVLPTMQLKDLAANDFKSYEQIRHERELALAQQQHEKELKISRYSFWLAFFALIVSLLSPLIFENTLDESQFTILIETIKKTSQ